MTRWHPVALSADIPPRTAAPIRLHGQEIALWRDGAGVLAAWEDRCPHRGMRLSFGFVRTGATGGDRLACLYHGWQFDAAGRCRHIPAHPDLTPPGTIRTRIMPVSERAGFVWLAADAARARGEGTQDRAREEPDGPVAGLRDGGPDDALGIRSIAIARDAATVASALGIGRGVVERRTAIEGGGGGGIWLGVHAPCDTDTMLHVCVEDPAMSGPAYRWVAQARDAIEAGRAVAWGAAPSGGPG